MFFSHEVTIPANTTEVAPVNTVARITGGVITKVLFRPRPGHNGLLRCRVMYHEHQLFPATPGESLHGDTFPVDWEENELIESEPFELVLRAWNTDDTYAHTFDISFVVLPPEQTLGAIISKALGNIMSIFSPRRIFGGGV